MVHLGLSQLPPVRLQVNSVTAEPSRSAGTNSSLSVLVGPPGCSAHVENCSVPSESRIFKEDLLGTSLSVEDIQIKRQRKCVPT